MTESVTVVIPSQLDQVHVETADELWLDRAVASVRKQTCSLPINIVVGLDHGAAAPSRFLEDAPEITFAVADEVSQVAAINAAVTEASGTYLAMREDDDRWQPRFLEHALEAIKECEFVSSYQLELPPDDVVGHINDFATPSGWCMRRSLWPESGNMATSFRFHLDNDWLGRLSDQGNRRVHLVEAGAATNLDELKEKRPFLHSFINAKPGFNFVVRHGEDAPLVLRTANPLGGMSMIKMSPQARAQREAVQTRLIEKFGRFHY